MEIKASSPTDETANGLAELRREFEEFREAANKEFSNINTL
jgi:hypothetical protein